MSVSTIGSSSQAAQLAKLISLSTTKGANGKQADWSTRQATQADQADFSKAAQSLANLANLADKSPSQFTNLVSAMAAKLQDAAANASNPTDKQRLAALATRFLAAGKSGKAADLQPRSASDPSLDAALLGLSDSTSTTTSASGSTSSSTSAGNGGLGSAIGKVLDSLFSQTGLGNGGDLGTSISGLLQATGLFGSTATASTTVSTRDSVAQLFKDFDSQVAGAVSN